MQFVLNANLHIVKSVNISAYFMVW